MATQKLFGDIPSGFSGIAGMVSPNITADITQKSAEDDASTLAGYKKRLELQSGQEATAYQNRLNFQRQMQQQWEQEDLKKQADQMRQLDAQRRQAFDVIYRPQVESGQKMLLDTARTGAAMGNQQIANLTTAHGPTLTSPASGATVIPGFGLQGGQWHTTYTGARAPGPDPNQTQQALNTMYGRSATAAQGQNVNPYYSNPYL